VFKYLLQQILEPVMVEAKEPLITPARVHMEEVEVSFT